MSKQDSRDEKRKAKEAADYYTAGAAHGGSVRILCLVLNCESVGIIIFWLSTRHAALLLVIYVDRESVLCFFTLCTCCRDCVVVCMLYKAVW